jgi:hypothetical protein
MRRTPMSDDSIAEADCALCRHLNPAQRSAMRAQLIVIPLRDPVCDGELCGNLGDDV